MIQRVEYLWEYGAEIPYHRRCQLLGYDPVHGPAPGPKIYDIPVNLHRLPLDQLRDMALTGVERLIQMPDQMGIMLFLTAFVTISPECAETFPWI